MRTVTQQMAEIARQQAVIHEPVLASRVRRRAHQLQIDSPALTFDEVVRIIASEQFGTKRVSFRMVKRYLQPTQTQSDDPNQTYSMLDSLPDDDECEADEKIESFGYLLVGLSPLERDLLIDHFVHDVNYHDCGQRHLNGLSSWLVRTQVLQILKKQAGRLRTQGIGV